MRASIPRFLLSRAVGDDALHEWFGTELAEHRRALFGFSNREAAERFLSWADLGTGWTVTYLGYAELRQWLKQARQSGYELFIRDAPSLSELVVDAAEIEVLVEFLGQQPDTGDEIRAEFTTYPAARLG